MIALVTPYPRAEIWRGVETFNYYLERVFPDMTSVTIAEARQGGSAWTKVGGLLPRSLRVPAHSLAMGGALTRLAKSSDLRLVISNGMYGWYDPLDRTHVPKVHIFHGSSAAFADASQGVLSRRAHLYNRYLYSYFEALSATGKDALVSVSEFSREMFLKYHNIETRVIANCVDTQLFYRQARRECRDAIGLPQDKTVCGYVAPLNEAKGFDVLSELAERNPHMVFLIKSPQMSSYRTADNMKTVYDVPFERMPSIYSALDVLIAPTLHEGCSFVAFEAMSCNVPVITSSTGCFWKMDGPCSFGEVLPLRSDAAAFERSIQWVLENREDLNPREYVTRNYSFDRFKRDYSDLVSKLLSRHS